MKILLTVDSAFVSNRNLFRPFQIGNKISFTFSHPSTSSFNSLSRKTAHWRFPLVFQYSSAQLPVDFCGAFLHQLRFPPSTSTRPGTLRTTPRSRSVHVQLIKDLAHLHFLLDAHHIVEVREGKLHIRRTANPRRRCVVKLFRELSLQLLHDL